MLADLLERLSFTEKTQLWESVKEFVTPERQDLYDHILQYRTRHFTIALEDIFQEHNAGALARTAECYGIQDVHVMKNHNEFRIAKGMAKGAKSWLDTFTYDGEDSVVQCSDHLRKQGYQIVATTPHKKAHTLHDFDISKKSAFFFGTEKDGLNQHIIDTADAYIYVPIYGVTESYNVSITSAIILHELVNKLHQSEFDWRLSDHEQVTKKLEWAYQIIRKPKILYRNYLKEINSSLLEHLQ